jgi:hypothetical protein
LGMKRTTLQYRMRKLGIEQKRVWAATATQPGRITIRPADTT